MAGAVILLLGASGFIGSALAEMLLADGHRLRAAGRDLEYGRRILPGAEWAFCELRRETDWAALLDGVGLVINASGALQSGLRDDVARVQQQAIGVLVPACRQHGVRHFIQISAAGVGLQASDFMQTKADADTALAESGLPYTIIRPGLVIGRNGFGGSELLRAAAGLPVGVRFGDTGLVQSTALTDVVDAVRRAVREPDRCTGTFDLAEAVPRPLGEIIALHRAWLGLPVTPITLHLPLASLRPMSLIADALGWLGWRSPLRSNAVAALAFGVRGDTAQASALLGRAPLSLPETFAGLGQAGKADRWHARIAAIYPLALAALVVLWLAGGVVGLVRLDAAAALLVQGGLNLALAKAIVIAGSLADIAIALAIVWRPTLRLALLASASLAAAYVLGAVMVRPDLWLDPLGTMVKVLPIVALSVMLHGLAEER